MEEAVRVSNGLGEENDLKRENFYILGCALVLGVLFDFLFYGKPFGISYPIFVFAFYGVFLCNLRNKLSYRFSFGWFLTLPVIALSFTYFLFSNELFKVLNFMAIPILLLLQTTLLTRSNRYEWYSGWFLSDIFYSMFARTFGFTGKPFQLIAKLAGRRDKTGKYAVLGKVLMGMLMAVPLVAVVIVLLSSADKVFELFISNIPNLLPEISFDDLILQGLIILCITLIIFSYIWSMAYRPEAGLAIPQELTRVQTGILDPVIVITILTAVNMIYVLFTVIQFTYLFGSIHFALPTDFTYAEYARRGFFELVAVTLINLSILLCSINLTKRHSAAMDRCTRGLNSLLVFCTMIILVSAHLRMSLYEATYGYTSLRLLTHAFMIYIFALLATALLKIWNKRISLLKVYIVISVVAYVLINYADIDVMIAANNIERYHKTQKIDAAYLTCLSNDAVPEVAEFMEKAPVDVANKIRENLDYRKERLSRFHSWESFNIADDRAKKALEKVLP